MPTWWICYFPLILLFVVLLLQRRETDQFIAARARRQKGDLEMKTIALRYIGKDVLLNTVASGSYDGIVKEVVDNAVVLEKDGEETVVNLDYVIRLREYPRNKRGRKKAVIPD